MRLFRRSQHPDGHILILDDEQAIRESLTRLFERRGYDVRSARNVEEALEAIDSDLRAAILDVMLVNSGGKSGIDVLAAIRQRPETGAVPVLMFTGYGLQPSVLAAIEQLGAHLIHKPLSFAQLADWVSVRTGMRAKP